MKPLLNLKSIILPLFALIALSASARAAVILSSNFTGVSKTGNTASSFSWNNVNGIDAPATSLDFFDATDGTTTVGFHDVTADQIDVNQNMTAGGWVTSFNLNLDTSTSTISLTQLIVDLRLTNGSGADNTTSSKSGRITVELVGSSSGSLGTVDPGNSAYPTVNYTRTVDLSSFADLDTSETYTLNVSALGTGFGHHKSMRGLSLEGDITAVPEPTTALLSTLGLLALLRRRR